MPEMLITETCLVNYGDDRGGVVESSGAKIDVPKDTARALVGCGRALYAKKSDDPDKNARDTASKELLDAAVTVGATKGKAKEPEKDAA